MTKILLVEDDKSLREIYGVRLLAEGYDIVSAGDGEEALAMAIKERPELIVSDVMMPKISGFDMLDILRSTTETKDIKVIMMTALSSEDQRARGEALGADRYLVKSQVGIEDVVRTVHDVLGDALAPAPAAAQTFATPAPSAQPRMAPAAAPAPRPAAPVYSPVAEPAPATPQFAAPAPTPASPPAFAQASVAQPVAPVPPLPLPTAPFSTPRPSNLGDRVINPIAQPTSSQPDIASMMNQELNRAAAPQPAPVPQAEPVSAASVSPQPVVAPQQSSTFTVPTAAPTGSTFAQPSALHGASNISFEETPLPSAGAPQAPSTPSNDNVL
jgi:CheY-like chemotaxis protein